MTAIVRAEHVYGLPVDLSELGGDEAAYRAAPLAALPALLLRNPAEGRALRPDELPDRTLPGRATAFVNDGRWVAYCPTVGCGSALVVSPTDPRILCPVCWLGYYRVEFPTAKEIERIEGLLSDRPGAQSRHWIPGVSTADLQTENHALQAAAAIDDLVPWHGRGR